MKILGFVSSNLERCVFYCVKRTSIGVRKATRLSTGKYAPRERPSIGVRRPSFDVQLTQWVDYQYFGTVV